MIIQSQLENPRIFRPKFTEQDLTLNSPRPKEKRFVSSLFVPHTVYATLAGDSCKIVFEYLIDEEAAATPIERQTGVQILIGKYSEKVVGINLFFSQINDLPLWFDKAIAELKYERNKIALESLQRSYSLIVRILENIIKSDISKMVEHFKSHGDNLKSS